mmetsp:Transcript_20228/g.51211  ORF Transcript_20228/g.51211 Transcript_20228/m.51211 type:complete len:97 (+) Transcript_20228:48-338(+)|eukprot:CAMPEP_0202865022 /NCGR_PEP_ID=MMETSP1391-20130828/5119_1 /ASSEMBLY_ACC=CAM_ASM_000867 /TAXON_ID=1034604 /ORGANISM="Chlamydomonas leiostraca, Strain SAG 11-49" /LENGTH=96 /DNA_ID=CAMNT_0049544809 /DNA_START=27 /DNA_END=317 /DNA_ORIENTATION=+
MASQTRFLFVALLAFVLLCGFATAATRSKKQEYLPESIRADGTNTAAHMAEVAKVCKLPAGYTEDQCEACVTAFVSALKNLNNKVDPAKAKAALCL